MNSLPNLSKITLLGLAITSTFLTGCDSDNNSDELARAVELEKLRANGTIIEEFEITNGQMRIEAGETHQLIAIGLDSKGNTRDVTSELTAWSSSDETIATVSSKGLVTGVKNSDIDQGKVTITGTTINDILGEGEISISDVAVSSITLKQTSPETGHIQTCIDASISSDVRYTDDYLSLNTIKDMTFTLDNQTSAVIDTNGMLYTSAEGIENTTITSTIGAITAELIVTADPKDLDTIDILLADEIQTVINLNIGDRIKVNAQANLLDTVSTETFDIDPSIDWQQLDNGLTGITNTGENKGTILALKAGVTELLGVCGGKDAKVILTVKGDAKLTDTQVNEGEDIITIKPLASAELILTGNYDASPTSVNVSEFAKWEIIGKDIVELELISAGLSSAHYKITSTSTSEGSVVISVIYDGIVNSVQIDIEK
jgi:hypothetical protein